MECAYPRVRQFFVNIDCLRSLPSPGRLALSDAAAYSAAWATWSDAMGVCELKHAQRVVSSDLDPVRLADGGVVEPLRGVIDVLERPVRGEQNAIGSDFKQGVDQGLGAKIS